MDFVDFFVVVSKNADFRTTVELSKSLSKKKKKLKYYSPKPYAIFRVNENVVPSPNELLTLIVWR